MLWKISLRGKNSLWMEGQAGINIVEDTMDRRIRIYLKDSQSRLTLLRTTDWMQLSQDIWSV
jgi:hypothetical protein